MTVMDQPQPVTPASSASSVPVAPPAAPPSFVLPGPTQPIDQGPAGVGVVYAGFGARFLASLVDGIVIALISGVLGLLAGIAGTVSGSETVSLFVSGFVQFFSVIISVAYYVYFIGSRGQTPGKMALKIKVIKADTQQAPGYLNAFLREAVGKFLSAIVLLLGYFWMLWDEKKQTWHDKIANTIVIKA